MMAQRAVLKAQLRGCISLLCQYAEAGFETVPTPLKNRIEELMTKLLEMEE